MNNSSYASTTKDQGVGGMGSFQTFCLEYNEWLAQGPVNYVVNDEAVKGGANTHLPSGNQSGDTLSAGTAWLYSQFAQGVLAGYNYSGSSRLTSAGLLQNAIWALEDEIENPIAGANPFFDLASLHGGEVNYTSGQDGVWVLNNTTANGTKKQDMLFYSTGASVPDGGSTLMLLGMALGGISLIARYKKLSPAG